MENRNRVFIYRNITKGCWSIRLCATRKVIAHASEFLLYNATFKVSEAGRQRVIREGRKNIHAGIEGALMSFTRINDEVCGVVNVGHYFMTTKLDFKRVYYNPYTVASFVVHNTDTPMLTSRSVIGLPAGSVYAI